MRTLSSCRESWVQIWNGQINPKDWDDVFFGQLIPLAHWGHTHMRYLKGAIKKPHLL